MKTIFSRFVWLIFLFFFVGCSSNVDFVKYREHLPKSILILPPQNESNEVDLPDITLALLPEWIAEAGYYVFPPLVVQDYFRANGAPSIAEINLIPPQKLHEIFGADAVLKTHIKKFDYVFLGLTAGWMCTVEFTLVDLRTGEELWHNEADVDQTEVDTDLVSAAIGTGVNLLISVGASDRKLIQVLSEQLYDEAFRGSSDGLLLGERRPNHGVDKRGIVEKAKGKKK